MHWLNYIINQGSRDTKNTIRFIVVRYMYVLDKLVTARTQSSDFD